LQPYHSEIVLVGAQAVYLQTGYAGLSPAPFTRDGASHTEVVVCCAGAVVASHVRCWAVRQTITDPAHVTVAGELRTAYLSRTAALRGPVPATGTEVGLRALSDYDELFALNTPSFPRPDLGFRRCVPEPGS